RDRPLILSIQKFFGDIGYVSKPNKYSTVEFRVNTLKDIVNIIIPDFDIYPLKTKKYYDYMFLNQVVFLMLNKEHNNLEGIQKIVNLKAYINLGLSKEAFPLVTPEKISVIEKKIDYKNLSPE